MKNKLMLSITMALCIMAHKSYAMEYTLPTAQVIRARLSAMGLDHFVEKTKIHTQLGNEQRAVMGVLLAVDRAQEDYVKYLQRPIVIPMQQVAKEILKDNAEALTELKQERTLCIFNQSAYELMNQST